MDECKASWILEFLLRQPIDDWIIHRLISILPVLDKDLRIKKSIILRGIRREVSRGSVSEDILELLEAFERLLHQEGAPGSESMKVAYCTVAVECTTRFLREEFWDFKEFVCAVDRIWKGRVSDLETLEGCSLVSDLLRRSKKEMMAAVGNVKVRADLVEKDRRTEALDAVRVFWDESMDDMGQSFLESEAEAKCAEGQSVKDAPVVDDDMTLPASLEEENTSARVKEYPVETNHAIQPVNQGCSDVNGIAKKYDSLQTNEVRKVKKALISSFKNLKAVVEDPLSKALETTSLLLAKTMEQTNEGILQNQKPGSPGGLDVAVNAVVRTTQDDEHASNRNDENREISRTGFMAPNPTARTIEWDDDDIESPSNCSPNRTKGVHLPSPRQRVISPLNVQEAKKFARRRKIKRWSAEEEETLRDAVLKHGRGNWKFILNNYRNIFADRTEIDLKDKWRNMVR